MMSQRIPVIVLFCTSVLWGTSWLPLKLLNSAGFAGISLILLNFVLLALLMTPTLLRQRQQWQPHASKLLLIALLGGGANLAFAWALIAGNVVRVMVLFYLLPIWGVLGGHLLLKERVDGWRWLGVVLAVTGAFIVLGGFRILQQPPSWIDLVSVLAGMLLAMSILAFRAVQAVPVLSKITAMFYGCALLAALLLLAGAEKFAIGHSAAAWSGMLAYTFGWLLVANLGSQWAVTHMETGRASIIIIMELVAAVVSATLIAGQWPNAAEVTGGLLILTAALIEAMRGAETAAPLQPDPG